MNDDQAFERATRAFLEDGSDRTPAATIDAVLLAVRTTPQERDLRIPWRTAPMSNPMRLVAAIAVIVVAGVAAFNLSDPRRVGGVGGASSPSPTVSPSAPAPSPSARPTPTPYSINTATWTTYTSARYGFSIGYPADWSVHTTATRDWTYPADATVNMYSTALETFVDAGQLHRRGSLVGRRQARHHARCLDPGLLPACRVPRALGLHNDAGPHRRGEHGWPCWLARAVHP